MPARSGAPSAPSAATAWSSRSPCPAEQQQPVRARARRRGRSPARCRWRPCRPGGGATSACSDAQASDAAVTESRSPTRTVGSRPAARAWSRPPSAATSVASAGTRRDGAGAQRRCAGDHHDRSRHDGHSSAGITRFRFSGRWRQPPSQPAGPASSPCWSGGRGYLAWSGTQCLLGDDGATALADDREGDEAEEDEDHPRHLRPGDRLAEDEVGPADGEGGLADLEDADRADVDVALGDAMRPWATMPVSTERIAATIQPRAVMCTMSSKASTSVIGAATMKARFIVTAMKSTRSTVARARRPMIR